MPTGRTWIFDVVYNGAGQTIVAGTYTNLVSSGSGTKTLAANTVINDNLELNSGTLDVTTNNRSITLGGNWVNNGGSFNGRSGTVTLNGTAQSISGSGTFTFHNLSLAGSGIKTFGQSLTINALTIAAGVQASLGANNHTAATLNLDGSGQPAGTWGSTASTATFRSADYFGTSGSGRLTVNTGTCAAGLWTGAVSTDWHTGGNWCGNAVPGSATDVIITSGLTANQPNIGSNATCRNLTIESGASLTVSGSPTLTVTGNWTNNGGTFVPGTGTVLFNNTGSDQSMGGTVADVPFHHLTVTKTGRTLNMTGSTATLTLTGDLSVTAGTLAPGGSRTVRFTGTNHTLSGSGTFNLVNLQFNNSGTVTVSSNIENISQTMTVNADAVIDPAPGIRFNNGFTSGTITGTGTIRVTRTNSTADYSNQYRFSTNTLSGLTVDYAGTGNQVINTFTYGNLVVSGIGTKSLAANTVINGNLELNSGTLDVTTSNRSITLGGNWVNGGGSFTQRSGTVTLNGAAQSISGSGSFTFNNLSLAGSGTKTFGPSLTINALTIASGVQASLSTNNHTAATLSLDGSGQPGGTWGSTVSTATFKNSLFFGNSGSGLLTVNAATCGGGAGQWTGAVSSDWHTAGNWCGNAVPGASTDVIISVGLFANQPVISSDATCRNLTIESGASLTVSGSPTLTVTGNWVNNGGTFTPGSGTVLFNNTGSDQSIGGTATDVPFHHLTIVKSSRTLSMAGSTATLSLTGNLTVTSGILAPGGSRTVRFTGTNHTLSGSGTFNLVNLQFNNSGTVTVSSNIENISQTMTVNADAVIDPAPGIRFNNGFTSGTITGTGTIRVTRTASTANYSNQYRFSTNTLSGLTVEYAGAGNQSVNALTYGGLVITGSGVKTAENNFTVNNRLTIESGSTLDMINFNVGGPSLTTTGTGLLRTTSAESDFSDLPTGVTWSFDVEYYRSGTPNQIVVPGNYSNLILSGSGDKILGSAVSIAGNLSISGAGSARAALNAGTTFDVTTLTLDGFGKNAGTWGSTSSTATNQTNTYFTATTGRVNVGTDTRPLLSITATGPTERIYGTPLAASITGSTLFTVTGLQSGNTVASVTLVPNAAGTSAFTPAGSSYSVAPSAPVGGGGFNAANYNITFVPYTGTVALRPLTITASTVNKSYGVTGSLNPSGFTVSGLANSDAVTSVTLTATSGLEATATVLGSPYAIVPSNATGTGLSNYSITYVNGNLNVTPAPLTITGIGVDSKVYDGTTTTNITGSPSYVGLQNGESFSVTGFPEANFSDPNAGTNKQVTVMGYVAPNPNYAVVNPVLTASITPAPLTISATDVFKQVDTSLPNPETGSENFEADGLVGDETIGSVTMTYSAGHTTGAAAGTYPNAATPSAATGGTFLASNYAITYLHGNVVVANVRYAVSSNNWNSTATWSASPSGSSGASVPTANDIVYIGHTGSSRTVTIPANYDAVCARLIIGTTSNDPTVNLTFSAATSTLTVSDFVQMNKPNGSSTAAININAGTMTVAGDVRMSIGTSTNNSTGRIRRINISTGTLNIGGNLVLGSRATNGDQSQVVFSNAGRMNLAGNIVLLYNFGRLTPSTSTVNFNGTSGVQTILMGASNIRYNNIEVNNTGAGAEINSAITATLVTGNLSVLSGTFRNNGHAITLASNRNFQVANDAAFVLTGTSTMTAVSGSGTKTFGPTSLVRYVGANQTVSAENYGNLLLGGTGTKTLAIPAATTLVTAGDFTLEDGITAVAQTGGNANLLQVGGNLTLNGTSTLQIPQAVSGAVTITGNLFISNGTTFQLNNASAFVTGGSTDVLGAFQKTTGTAGSLRFDGPLSLFSTGTFTNNANANVELRNGLVENGNFQPGTGIYNFTTNNQSLQGAVAIPNVTVTGITLTNQDQLEVGTNLAGTGTLQQGSGSTLVIGGTSPIANLNAAAADNLVIFNSTTSAQTVNAGSYFNLQLQNSLGLTAAGTTTINGTLTLTAGAWDASGRSLTFRNANIPLVRTSGTITTSSTTQLQFGAPGNSGGVAFTVPNGVFTNTPAVVGSLILHRDNPLTLSSQNLEIQNSLQLNNSILGSGSNVVILTPGATLTRGTGYVQGNLRKFVPAATNPVVTFETGDAGVYAPVTITVNGTVSAATGSITVRTTGSEHPNLGEGSGINPFRSLNRYWTVNNTTPVPGLTSYNASFQYAAGENDPGTTPADYVVRRYDGASWSPLTLSGTPSATNAAVSSVSGFGEFAIGEIGVVTVATHPVSQVICAGSNASFTAASSSVPAPDIVWLRDNGGPSGFEVIDATTDGGIYSGFNTGTLLIQQPTQSGIRYQARFTNIFGVATSEQASLTVNPVVAPTVNLAITNGSNPTCTGNSVTVTATASQTGGGTVNYRFLLNNAEVQNGSANTYIHTSVENNDAIRCEISVTGGSCLTATTANSNTITFTASAPATPVVNLVASTGNTICAGTGVQFTASATNTGGGSISYQFLKNGNPVGTAGSSNTFFTSAIATGDVFSCLIVITGGSCLSSNTVTSNGITMTVVDPNITPTVTISATPGSSVCSGTPVTFTANTTGTAGGEITYNFRLNGSVVQSGSNPVYTLSNPANGNKVTCQIAVGGGTCITTTSLSNEITLNVAPQPAVTLNQLPLGDLCAGTSVTFTATASNASGGTFTYTFFRNGIQQQSGSSNQFTTSSYVNSDVITCEVLLNGGTCGGATAVSNARTLSVVNSLVPVISVNVSPGATICGGSPVTFTATASNTSGGSITYDFKVNGASVQRSGSNVYTTTELVQGNIVTCTVEVGGLSCGTPSATSDGITISVPGGGYVWTGTATTEWSNPANWNASCGLPPAGSSVVIPSGAPRYPVVNAGTITVVNITVQTGASITIGGTAVLRVAGAINNSGTFNVLNGTVEFNGTSTQLVNGSVFQNSTIRNIRVSNDVTLTSPLNVTGAVSFGSVSNKTLNSAGHLVLKSTAAGTAAVEDLTNTNTSSGNAITGIVTVERFIPAGRKWRGLSAPLRGTTQNSIFDNWQNGGVEMPQTGVLLWSPTGTGAGGNGFSPNSNPGASANIRGYSISSFTTPTSTKEALLFNENGPVPYLVFVTDQYRSGNTGNMTSSSSATTLKAKGTLVTGNYSISAMASGIRMIANPYAAPIDFATIGKTNIDNQYWLWDPKLAGSNGVGGYVYTANSGSGYISVPTGGSFTGTSTVIPSGSAFWVRVNDGFIGSLQFKETDKATGGFNVFGRVTATNEVLRVNLTTPAGDATYDGVATVYNNTSTAGIDPADARKFSIGGENISLRRFSQDWAIEFRPVITGPDTVFLRLHNMQQKTYRMEISGETFAADANLTAVLQDLFLGTETPLNIYGSQAVNFSVTSNTASSGDRFRIVFRSNVITNLRPDRDLQLKGVDLYPNPAPRGGEAQLRFTDLKAGQYQLVVYTVQGTRLLQQNIAHAGGTVIHKVQLPGELAAGVYYAEVVNDKGQRRELKLIIQ
ncbi:MAG TPA: YDG domain-containing protein [Lacibacter sp.]|nr:YDG domain-containing protein [Lacibacter sp.]HMO89701.1 YDG domain-containing protein [Lacibacter sp.]